MVPIRAALAIGFVAIEGNDPYATDFENFKSKFDHIETLAAEGKEIDFFLKENRIVAISIGIKSLKTNFRIDGNSCSVQSISRLTNDPGSAPVAIPPFISRELCLHEAEWANASPGSQKLSAIADRYESRLSNDPSGVSQARKICAAARKLFQLEQESPQENKDAIEPAPGTQRAI